MQAMSGLDERQPVAGLGPVGEVRLVPDLETFRVLPYVPRTGAVLTAQSRRARRCAVSGRRR
jgi:glutamine synthetase